MQSFFYHTSAPSSDVESHPATSVIADLWILRVRLDEASVIGVAQTPSLCRNPRHLWRFSGSRRAYRQPDLRVKLDKRDTAVGQGVRKMVTLLIALGFFHDYSVGFDTSAGDAGDGDGGE